MMELIVRAVTVVPSTAAELLLLYIILSNTTPIVFAPGLYAPSEVFKVVDAAAAPSAAVVAAAPAVETHLVRVCCRIVVPLKLVLTKYSFPATKGVVRSVPKKPYTVELAVSSASHMVPALMLTDIFFVPLTFKRAVSDTGAALRVEMNISV